MDHSGPGGPPPPPPHPRRRTAQARGRPSASTPPARHSGDCSSGRAAAAAGLRRPRSLCSGRPARCSCCHGFRSPRRAAGGLARRLLARAARRPGKRRDCGAAAGPLVWKNGSEPLREGADHLREQPHYPAAGPPGPGDHRGLAGRERGPRPHRQRRCLHEHPPGQRHLHGPLGPPGRAGRPLRDGP